jgi:hypothetical protein
MRARQYCAPMELTQLMWGPVFYKHFVPPALRRFPQAILLATSLTEHSPKPDLVPRPTNPVPTLDGTTTQFSNYQADPLTSPNGPSPNPHPWICN